MIRNYTQAGVVASRSTVRSVVAGCALVVLVLFSGALLASPYSTEQNWGNQNWTNYVRIGAYGLRSGLSSALRKMACLGSRSTTTLRGGMRVLLIPRRS